MKNTLALQNNDPIICNIINEAYNDFILRWGEEYNERVKGLFIECSSGIKEHNTYAGGTATTIPGNGIRYNKQGNIDELSGIIKHELFHVVSKNGRGMVYPEEYIQFLEKLEHKGEELFVPENEKWTEWFNCETNRKDTIQRIRYRNNGFFFKTLSTGAGYDHYKNLAEMMRVFFDDGKLLAMYMNDNDFETDFSYMQMMREFDTKYVDCLTEEERAIYGYPYLKILQDTKKIDMFLHEDNIDGAVLEYQDATKTIFRAYLSKISQIQNPSMEDISNMYNQIKLLQENMMWNVDLSKIEDNEYIKVLEQIQETFKQKVRDADIGEEEKKSFIDSISYKDNNLFELLVDDFEVVSMLYDKGEELERKKIGNKSYCAGRGRYKGISI